MIIFVISLIGVVIATPLASKIALQNKIIDQPGLHKTHKKAKPLLGGLAIFVVFAVTLLIYLPFDEKLLSLVISTGILVITGLFDDIYNLKPLIKLTGQLAAAVVVVLWNAHLFRFMVEYFAQFYIPAVIVFVLIIGWVVLMINAFNLIDGLDGLAAGTAAIIFLAMAVLSIMEGGRPNILGVQLIGAGVCLGFLIYNFYPAKIFMGDAGSMLLGFIIVTAHLHAIKNPFNAQLVLGSMFIMAYPALDIVYAIYRRIRSRRSIFQADKEHIHHMLIKLGFTIKQAVLIILVLNVLFAGIAVLLLSIHVPTFFLFIIWLFFFIGVVVLFRYLNRISRTKKWGVSN